MEKGFSPEWIQKLKENNDIVSVISKSVTLVQKGKTYWGCCPFHFEKTPSFAVNQYEQYYHCFGCGASGDVVKFVEQSESVEFYDAIKILAKNANMELPDFTDNENIVLQKKKKDLFYKILKDTANYYYQNLKLPEAKVALDYLQKRSLNLETIKKFGIGYSLGWHEVITYLKKLGYQEKDIIECGVAEKKDKNIYDAQARRLVFPIINSYGDVVGFSARVLEKTDFAKYKNTAQTLVFDKSKCVYGINIIKQIKSTSNLKEIIIVEGQMDVISLHKAGICNAVACMGTALTSNHAKEMKRFCDKVVVCFDGDGAGKKATLRSIEILVGAGLNVYVTTIPNGQDPDEFVKEHGKEEYLKLIDNAKYWVDFLIDDFAQVYNLNKNDEKRKFVLDCLNVIKTLESESEQDIYLTLVKNYTNISNTVLKNDLIELKNSGSIEINKVEEKNEDNVNMGNAYIRAIKYILSALLRKKDYAYLSGDIENNIMNSDYLKIYKYVKEEKEKGNNPIISTIFDMFNVEDNRDIYDIVNYEITLGEDCKSYYEDCVKTLIKCSLEREQKDIMTKLPNSNEEEKQKLLLELQKIINKRKELI